MRKNASSQEWRKAGWVTVGKMPLNIDAYMFARDSGLLEFANATLYRRYVRPLKDYTWESIQVLAALANS